MPTPQPWRNSPAVRDARRKWPREPTRADSRRRELQRATSQPIAVLPAQNAQAGIPRSRQCVGDGKKSIELRSNMPVLCARICHSVCPAHSRLRVARAPYARRTGPRVATRKAGEETRSKLLRPLPKLTEALDLPRLIRPPPQVHWQPSKFPLSRACVLGSIRAVLLDPYQLRKSEVTAGKKDRGHRCRLDRIGNAGGSGGPD
jgi:hypothetical protein